MAGDLLALLYTVLMIVAVVAFAFVLHRWAHLPAEATRKLIHIGVSNSIFILTGCFDNLAWAMAGLALFAASELFARHAGAPTAVQYVVNVLLIGIYCLYAVWREHIDVRALAAAVVHRRR